MSKKIFLAISLLVVAAMVLAACAPATAEPTEAPEAEEAFPEATEEPLPEPEESPVEAAMAKLGEWLASDTLTAKQKDFIRRHMQGKTLEELEGLLESSAAASAVNEARAKGGKK